MIPNDRTSRMNNKLHHPLQVNARGYFEVMERQDVATLHSIIARCVRIGTEVHSDDWATYWQMDLHIHSVSHHKAVVHWLHFVDPVTGIHTQEVESCWKNLKLGQKIHKGIGREDMQFYLDEKMRRQWRAENPQNAIMFPLRKLHYLA